MHRKMYVIFNVCVGVCTFDTKHISLFEVDIIGLFVSKRVEASGR